MTFWKAVLGLAVIVSAAAQQPKPASVSGQRTAYPPVRDQIPGPASREERAAWLAEVTQWREERRIRIGYSPEEYERPELQWCQASFVQPQMMVEERYFYDPEKGAYTVDRYLDDLVKRYGGIDAVLIWPVYPNIGIDDRNQLDMLRDLPGGLPGIRKMIGDFHRRNVRVLFPVMPWDNGTRPEGEPLWTAAAKLMAAIGADGINGDTFYGLPHAFREASDKTGHILALQPENSLDSDEGVRWQNMTWGYWQYPAVPSISKLKWLEPRHMVNVCRRWARDKTDDLQAAFFNGVGIETWENVWGIWNGITPRDGETIRRIARIEREFAPLLVSQGWEPHAPTLRAGVFASRWPGGGETLWTLINKEKTEAQGAQISVGHAAGRRYYDVYHGLELQPDVKDGAATLSFAIEALGYGAVLAVDGSIGPRRQAMLAEMREMTRQPLASFSNEWKSAPQKLVEIARTRPRGSAPEGMIRIPANPSYEFKVAGVMIEGANEEGVGVQYPWEPSARRKHQHTLSIASFYIDRYPVTNAEFKKFLDASNYRARDSHNFLRDWKSGSYPEGWAKKPVTWVSIEDARAYAAWAGKRLPHEWEWQYAAQGQDGRTYPWGGSWKDSAVPAPNRSRRLVAPADVDAHPEGASPFGVMDLVGNVWQWTDEYLDEHTRSGILRGGSSYLPQKSWWYFPQAQRNDQHAKYLLMAPGKDRSGTVGFRCAADAQD